MASNQSSRIPIELIGEIVKYLPLNSFAIQNCNGSWLLETLVKSRRIKWMELMAKRREFIVDFLHDIHARSELSIFPFHDQPEERAKQVREAIEKLRINIQKKRPLIDSLFALELSELRVDSGLENWFELNDCEFVDNRQFGHECQNIRHLLLAASYTLNIPMRRPYRPDLVTANAMLQLQKNQQLLEAYK